MDRARPGKWSRARARPPNAAAVRVAAGWPTPISATKTGLPYSVHPIDIHKRQQFAPEYLALNPNGKIPTIVDQDGPGGKPITIFESGAILIYLAEKTDRFVPAEPRGRYEVIQWLMFQMGGVGPMFGQAHIFFHSTPEPVPFAIERYSKETRRLYGVLQARLKDHQYLAGDYSIADIATYPWVARFERHKVNLEDFPPVKRWFDEISGRRAVQRGMAVPKV